MINTAEHVRKLRDEQTKRDQTRLQYDEFLKSLVYKRNLLPRRKSRTYTGSYERHSTAPVVNEEQYQY